MMPAPRPPVVIDPVFDDAAVFHAMVRTNRVVPRQFPTADETDEVRRREAALAG